jgi:hypothetical protein
MDGRASEKKEMWGGKTRRRSAFRQEPNWGAPRRYGHDRSGGFGQGGDTNA